LAIQKLSYDRVLSTIHDASSGKAVNNFGYLRSEATVANGFARFRDATQIVRVFTSIGREFVVHFRPVGDHWSGVVAEVDHTAATASISDEKTRQ
jgi:hypothetical protein